MPVGSFSIRGALGPMALKLLLSLINPLSPRDSCGADVVLPGFAGKRNAYAAEPTGSGRPRSVVAVSLRTVSSSDFTSILRSVASS